MIKRFFAFDQFFGTSKKIFKNDLPSDQKATDLICSRLETGKPCMIARFGNIELELYQRYMFSRSYFTDLWNYFLPAFKFFSELFRHCNHVFQVLSEFFGIVIHSCFGSRKPQGSASYAENENNQNISVPTIIQSMIIS